MSASGPASGDVAFPPGPKAAPGFRLWAVLGLAVTAQTAGSIVSQGVYTLVPFLRSELELPLSAAALAVTALNGGQILSMFSLGRLIDRHGERAVVTVTMIGMGLTAIAGARLAGSYASLLAWLVLLGMFYASVQPGGTRAILRWFPPRHRGLATGFRQAAVPLGTSIAAALLPWIASSSGWRGALVAQGLVGIAGGVFFWLFYREGDLAEGGKPPRIPVRELVATLGRDSAFWPVVGAGVAMSAFQFTFTAGAIAFMSDSFGVGLVAAASLFAFVQVVGIPGRVLLPWVCDRLWPGRRVRALGWIMAACAIATVAYLFLPPGAPAWALYPVLALLGIFGIGWFPLYILQIAEIAPKSAIASTVSFATTLCMVAMSLAPFLFGAVVDLAGYRVAWLLLVAPVVLLVPVLVRLPARRA
ncbi:MFS transporter [Roseomonas nepalensis]|uniref:MFS transporter n=1 Tax=Muricoccus nepalensis TaxID=1854500 RepID=A0A502FS70_9PROT|nr:MFS transporter [Roseomonas nepalensis]TPG52305.1 MFS transporter [Roseomonas nepalensis]